MNHMKRVILIFSLITSIGFSQNINDALLFSSENIQGTARFNAMSGAFGALGGDLTAININPAGSAVFNKGTFTGTLAVNGVNNDAVYFGTETYDRSSNISINQLGGVFVLQNPNINSDWRKTTMALNYNKTQDFNQQYFVSGNSPTSIDTYFLEQANGLAFEDIQYFPGEFIEEAYLNILEAYGFQYQQAFLGYYGGVIDPVDASDPFNAMYVGTGNYSTVKQDYLYSSSGANSKFNFNLATQYKDILYLGMSLNGSFINSKRVTSIIETGYDASSDLEFVSFNNSLKTIGSGFSMQFGAIAKVGKQLRLGAAYHSPTWFVLNDELSQSINSNLADRDIGFIGSNQVIVFQNYNLRTPSKLSGSAAFIFGKQGLLSFDYHYKDYNNVTLKPSSSFSQTNININSSLKGTSSVNLGGEYRIQKWSLRAGYRFEESPYKNKYIIDDLKGYSLGFGYNFGISKIDFSFNRSKQNTRHQLYPVGLTNTANISSVKYAVMTSFTLKL